MIVTTRYLGHALSNACNCSLCANKVTMHFMEYRGENGNIVICGRCVKLYADGMIADLIQLQASERIGDIYPHMFFSRTDAVAEKRQAALEDEILLLREKVAAASIE